MLRTASAERLARRRWQGDAGAGGERPVSPGSARKAEGGLDEHQRSLRQTSPRSLLVDRWEGQGTPPSMFTC